MAQTLLEHVILIGTTNRAKFERYAGLVRDAFAKCDVHVVEDGRSASENAQKKALAYVEE